MPVVYHCPHCRQPVNVPDTMLGQAITCPQCRGAFQTQPSMSTARPQPLSLDDDEPGGAFDKLDDAPTRGSGMSRYRKQQKGMPLPNRLALAAVIAGTAGMTAYNRANQRGGQGFNVTEMLIAGAVGAVCAAIGFGIGKLIEASNETRHSARDDD